MRKKILIISSEPLTRDFTLGSSFELSQAKILSHTYDIALLSAQVHLPLIQVIRTYIKRILVLQWKKAFRSISDLFEMLVKLVGKNRLWTDRFEMEGIEVFSGNGFTIGYQKGDSGFHDAWIESAYHAYLNYEKAHGKPDLVHAHGRFMIAGLLALKLKREKAIRYVYTEHSSRFPSGFVPSSAIPLLDDIIDNCTRYIAVSEPLLKKVEETLDRTIPKAKVVPNVLDPVFQVPLSKELPGNHIVFIVVANLEHRKGIDVLLRGFKRAFHGHHGYRLQVIGDGPSREDLIQLCSYLELDHVVDFVGEQTKFEVVKYLDRAHIFVLPSRFETFGVSVIEGMSRGCPVIFTSCGGPEDLVPTSCGIMIAPENENALVASLREMTKNFSQYNLLEISKYAVREFGSEKFMDNMNEVYGDVFIVIQTLPNSSVETFSKTDI